MFGTRDLFSKSKQINEAAESFFQEDLERVVTFLKKTTSLTYQSSLEKDELRKIATTIVEQIREHSEVYYLERILQQGKQLSQIIAYIWRWIDVDGDPKKEIAEQLKQYFVRPTIDGSENSDENLKNLLGANPKEDNPTENANEARLLREVFLDYKNEKLIFPIFNESELGRTGYLIEVTVNSFNGMLEDGDRNNPNTIKFIIPFPPKPQFGKGTITPSELEEWIINKDNKYVADNPYIPTTCS